MAIKMSTNKLEIVVVMAVVALNIATITYFIRLGAYEEHVLVEGNCYNLPCAYHMADNTSCVYQLGYNYYLNRSLDCTLGKHKLTCCFTEEKLDISFVLWYVLLTITFIIDLVMLVLSGGLARCG